jgi:hypothetical protein
MLDSHDSVQVRHILDALLGAAKGTKAGISKCAWKGDTSYIIQYSDYQA